MNTLTKLVLIAALILSVLIPFGYFLLGQKKKSRYKKALGVNVFFFFGTLLIAAVVMLYPERVQAASAPAIHRPGSDIWQRLFLLVFPASAEELPWPAPQALLSAPSVRTAVFLVNL